MNKLLYSSLIIISTVLVLVGALFFLQTINQSSTNAEGVVSYNETWVATGGVYGYVEAPNYYQIYMKYANGIPGAGAICGQGYGYSTQSYGFASCQFSPTQWSVTGSINSGTTGVKRYFTSSTYYHYTTLQSLSSSACNNDANNPGGFYHVYLSGATQVFVTNGTTIQGPYGTGIAGQDTYLSTSYYFWSTRPGEYSRLMSGSTLGGMTFNGNSINNNFPILCIED